MTIESDSPENAATDVKTPTRNLVILTLVLVAASAAWFLFSQYQAVSARLDGTVVEQQFSDSNDAIASANCPSSPSASDNTTFRCIVTGADDLVYTADVQVTGDDITWEIR